MSKREVLSTYVLQVQGPVNHGGSLPRVTLQSALLRETEENLTDLLPEGYSVKIKEWDSPGPGYEPAGMHWTKESR